MMPAVRQIKDQVLHWASKGSEALNARSPREKKLIVIFGLAFILALDYFVWAAPVIKSLSEGLPLRSRNAAQIAQLRDYESTRDLIQKKNDLLREKMNRLEVGLVGTDQVPAFLESLSQVARGSGVKITSLSPLPQNQPTTKNYEVVPIQIYAVAGAHELGRFIDALESGQILIRVTQLKITGDPSGGKQHKIELSLAAYRRVETKNA